tara:strand:- start:10 stop:234 length:225 start_codon:yes stop_codon:yes gene_type:complete
VLLGRGRKHALARERHLMFLLAYELSHQSLPQIGKAMNRDHSTIWHGCNRARERMETDYALRFTYDKLKSELRG